VSSNDGGCNHLIDVLGVEEMLLEDIDPIVVQNSPGLLWVSLVTRLSSYVRFNTVTLCKFVWPLFLLFSVAK
jgi:hypothetical protein